LVLKEFLRLDYRKLQAVLKDSPTMAVFCFSRNWNSTVLGLA
jgi:hypothetical protein